MEVRLAADINAIERLTCMTGGIYKRIQLDCSLCSDTFAVRGHRTGICATVAAITILAVAYSQALRSPSLTSLQNAYQWHTLNRGSVPTNTLHPPHKHCPS